MHVLVTTDTLSDVWTYTRELVTGLVSRGVRVTLVSLGEIPLPHQTVWMDHLQLLDYRPTAFRLDWMQEGERDLKDSSAFLAEVVRDIKPDLLHLNHLCYGSLPVAIPRIVVAHADLVSWWKAVHGREPDSGRWMQWYRRAVVNGLSHADAVVAPSVWMLDTIRASYVRPTRDAVIYHGRNPVYFNPYVAKEESVLAVGRLWDASKQVSLLTQQIHSLPVCIAGAEAPVGTRDTIRTDVKVAVNQVRVAVKGPQTEAQMRNLYSRASIFAATARYEPFGMSAVEAALSRCAIAANDIPSMRELWGEAALYFSANDAGSLAELVRRLGSDRELRLAYANRAYQRARECFTSMRMVEEYLRLYRTLVFPKRLVA
ncbi:MAG TPA: glycosyltransferase family 4 protein [Terriglobales bacterium]|nr:glycosyltransferase family 4 protein [Terriglobales bacterium]